MPAKTAIFCVMLIFGVLAAGACGSDDSEPGLPSRTQALIIADTASERCGEPVGEPSPVRVLVSQREIPMRPLCRGG